MQTPPTTVPAIRTISTSVEHQGDNVIISAGTEEHLRAYLHSIGITEVGEIRQTGIVIGPIIGIPSTDALISEGTKRAIEFAKNLGICAMSHEITMPEEREAKNKGLVVVFGYSDDTTGFRGAIHDEVGMGEISITPKGKILSDENIEGLDALKAEGICTDIELRTITADFIDGVHQYTTDIPHGTFDVREDGELFCRGIVFALSDLTR